jgi:membrane-associated phospholipid phosphatase
LMKAVVDRPRPDASLIEIVGGGPALAYSEASFPSGHVVQYTVLLGLLYVFSERFIDVKWQRWVRGLCLALIILIGPARVYMGAHWPSDVVGAYLFGGIALWMLVWLYFAMVPTGVRPRNRASGTETASH